MKNLFLQGKKLQAEIYTKKPKWLFDKKRLPFLMCSDIHSNYKEQLIFLVPYKT